MTRNQHTQPSQSPVEQAPRDLAVMHRVDERADGFPRHTSETILAGHLLPILRREQREICDAPMCAPLFRAEEVPQPLLLQPITEHEPCRLTLLVGERRQALIAPVVGAELSPVSQPVGFLRKVG